MIDRLLRAARRPHVVAERVRQRFVKARFRRTLQSSAPIPVPTGADTELHLFFGGGSVYEGIATAKSLLRFTKDTVSVTVHEDGTLGASGRDLLDRHLPGIRIIDRATADESVVRSLRDAGYERCARWRESFVLAPKLLDLAHYARARTVIYADADVLFLAVPREILSAAGDHGERWFGLYNRDVRDGYCWSDEQVRDSIGATLPDRFNSGLLCYTATDAIDYPALEALLGVPPDPAKWWFAEQTAYAALFSLRGATPLPDSYDVCFRAAHRGDYYMWLRRAEGAGLQTTQHYAGPTWGIKRYFYRHFVDLVAPSLPSSSA